MDVFVQEMSRTTRHTRRVWLASDVGTHHSEVRLQTFPHGTAMGREVQDRTVTVETATGLTCMLSYIDFLTGLTGRHLSCAVYRQAEVMCGIHGNVVMEQSRRVRFSRVVIVTVTTLQ